MITQEIIIDELINLLNLKQEKSYAEKRKVGAVILNHENVARKEIGKYYGWNRQPVQIGNVLCENSNGNTYESVIHAEEAVIFEYLKNCKTQHSGDILICTYSPCYNCCKLIVQSGIKTLYYYEKHSTNFTSPTCDGEGYSPEEFLLNCGISVNQITDEMLNPIAPKRKQKIALITHSKDVDGYMSRYLLEHSEEYRDKDFISFPYDYYDKDMEWENDPTITTFVFGDITPRMEWLKQMQIPIALGDIEIIIYDHHEDKLSQIREFDTGNKILIYSNTNILKSSDTIFSAAYIILTNLYKRELVGTEYYSNIELVVRLISLYDTWEFTKQKNVENFSIFSKENIVFFDTYMYSHREYSSFTREIDASINADGIGIFIHKLIGIGKLMNETVLMNNEKIVKSLYHNKDTGFVLFQGDFNYFLQELIKEVYGADILMISFKIDFLKQIYKFSFRGKDALKVAKAFGGSGHDEAAGGKATFDELKVEDMVEDIYQIIKKKNTIK